MLQPFARAVLVAGTLLIAAEVHGAQSAPPVQAEAPLPPKLWSDLNGQQQQVLASVRGIGDELAPDVQEHLAATAQRWPKLTDAQREQFTKRIEKWASLTPAQRNRLRERYQQFHQLPPEQQLHMINAFKRFDALPEAERAQLREQFERMSPAERNAFVAASSCSTFRSDA